MRHFKDFRRLGQGCALAALIALSMEPDPAMAAQPPVPISAAEYDRLTPAADRDAIRELVNRYFDAAWRQDAEMFLGELFAPKMEHITIGAGFAADGQLRADGSSTSQRHVTKGAGPLRELYLRALSAGPLPFGHNHVVDLLGPDRARGRVAVELRTVANFDVQQIVMYEDDYIKIDGKWKFLRRVGHALKPGGKLVLDKSGF